MDGFDQPSSPEFVRPALLQEPAGRRIRCLTCERRCEIVPGGLGWCRTRRHQDGTLLTLVYGDLSSLSANPIEKKPFFHFYPGTRALTSGSWSCNFGCLWCQNHDISKATPGSGRCVSPQDFVGEAVESGCQGTSFSLNEPTLSLEWSLDVVRLARARGLYNTYVTNGYMTAEALRLLADAGLDAMNVDVKGDAETVRWYCKEVDVEKVWRTCQMARELRLHLEITTLVIPGVNDQAGALRDVAERITTELGPDVPWHISGYRPAYRFSAPATPVSTLERAWHIGKQAGLDFVYLGNVPGHRLENTYCPECGALLIERLGFAPHTARDFEVSACYLDRGRCPQCDREVPGVWGQTPVSRRTPEGAAGWAR